MDLGRRPLLGETGHSIGRRVANQAAIGGEDLISMERTPQMYAKVTHTQVLIITNHALARMHQRSVSDSAIDAALSFGREVHTRGATIYAIGRREVIWAGSRGEDISHFEGVQVVCAREGNIITVYRNRNFKTLKPKRGRRFNKAA
jgi:hypothetical protein